MFTVNEVLAQHYPQLTQRPWLFKSLNFVLRRLLHESEFHAFAERYPQLHGMDFVEQLLDYFNVSYSVRDTEKENIPTDGPVVIIANHPIGSLDGLALIKLVNEIRPDTKIIANQMLMALQPLRSMLLPVNVMTGSSAKADINRIKAHLSGRGALIIFPAGEVSRLRPQGIRDTHWHSGFLRIASSVKAPILPIFIDAKNSPFFYSASLIYKPLSTALLVTEMFKHRCRHFPIRVGRLVPYQAYGHMPKSIKTKTQMFKRHLYRIGNDKRGIFPTQNAIAPPECRRALSLAIHQDCESLGHTPQGKAILLYRNQGSSPILRELGRLREIAFRAVGEGSNQRRDIDEYDHHYYHILLWDQYDLEIIGAYRLGDAKRTLQEKGKEGIYSTSLFHFGTGMDKYLEHGLELGRSFIQPKYWGLRGLDYLWLGIGAFLLKYPQYRYLFGPVSISNDLPQSAKELLVAFYSLYFGSEQILATPLSPVTLSSQNQTIFSGDNYQQDFAQLKSMLAGMGAAIPTLYKQYTDLCEPGGAQFLTFSIDPSFGHCIDGLIVLDITKLKPKKRQRYMTAMQRTVSEAPR